MAENDNEDKLNLELPSFGRKKRKRKDDEAETHVAEESVAEPTVVLPAVDDPTDALPADDTPDRFAPPPSSEPTTPHEPAPAPYVAPETLGAADEALRPEAPLPPVVAPAPARAEARAAKRAEKPARTPKPEKPARELTLPAVNGMIAAVIVGALVGLLACGATYLGLLGCQEIRGTSACGGPGFFLLLAILIALIVLGKLLLKAFRVIEPGSTSFLGVGLMAVITLAFLIDVVFEWWMIIVIPVVTALTFAGSHWLTERFNDPADDGSDQVVADDQ